MRNLFSIVALGSLTGVLACGGKGAQQGQAAPSSTALSDSTSSTSTAMTVPDWMHLDRAARTVELEITAAAPGASAPFDYNGYTHGGATITVPAGFAVTIHFSNQDQAQAHSLAILGQVGDYPASFSNPQPAFPKAMTSSPTSTDAGTRPGQSETLQFTAGTPGHYAMVCLMPGHAVAGMWVRFDISGEGAAGVSPTS
jgi:sulfocyanin